VILFIQKNGKVKERRLCVHGSLHVSSQFSKDPLRIQQLQPLHEILAENSNSSIQMKLYCVLLNIFKISLCLIKLWTSCIGLTIFVKVILLCYMLCLGIGYQLHSCFLLHRSCWNCKCFSQKPSGHNQVKCSYKRLKYF
jgi:hypothetical protein